MMVLSKREPPATRKKSPRGSRRSPSPSREAKKLSPRGLRSREAKKLSPRGLSSREAKKLSPRGLSSLSPRRSPRGSTPPKRKLDVTVDTEGLIATTLSDQPERSAMASDQLESIVGAASSGAALASSNDLRRLRFPNHADPRGIVL